MQLSPRQAPPSRPRVMAAAAASTTSSTRLQKLCLHLGGGVKLLARCGANAAAAGTVPAAPGQHYSVVEVGESRLVYRGSQVDPTTIYAGFPSLVRFDDQHLGCAFTCGPSSSSDASRAVFARSRDGGDSWQLEGPIQSNCLAPADMHTPSDVRVSLDANGDLLGLGTLLFKHPDDTSPAGTLKHAGGGRHPMGYTHVKHCFWRSKDCGMHWGAPVIFEPPLVGPSWELCCPILDVGDGRLMAPVSTWPSWHGDSAADQDRQQQYGTRWDTVAFLSETHGKTWSDHVSMYQGELDGESTKDLVFWENKLIKLGGKRLLNVAWTVDTTTGVDRCVSYVLSEDSGRTWSAPRSTGLVGQTTTPLHLGDDRLLCVYRRKDVQGLWAVLARIDGTEWVTHAQFPIWGTNLGSEQTQDGFLPKDMSEVFNVLSFGLPSMVQFCDGSVLMAFWCEEKGITNIRTYRLRCT
jgi:hypothetical protein